MKANKAPKKIYLKPLLMENGESIMRRCTLEKQNDNQIEYVRKDVFIEKACEWLESVNLDFYQIREGVFSRELVDDFRKVMKGEYDYELL